MTPVTSEEKLSDLELARFVADGFLRYDGLVPTELCERVVDEFESGACANVWPHYENEPPELRPGKPLSGFFGGTAAGEMLHLPRVSAIVEALVGPAPLYDHHYFHVTSPGGRSQALHYDAIIDFRLDFDIQLFFFMEDTTPEMGGTLLLPGSHLRPAPDLSRMQNVVGQVSTVCPRGTLLVTHQGIWHAGQPNRSNRKRHVLKVRLNQTPGWSFPRRERTGQPDEARAIKDALTAPHGWEGSEIRHEYVRRIRLWRLVTGDDGYDTESWLRRLDCSSSGVRL